MSTDVAPEVAAPVAPVAPAAAGARKGRPKLNKTAIRGKDDPKFTEWPAAYNPAVHTPITVEDFEQEDVYWDHKAVEYDKKAVQCRKNADMFRRFGSAEKRKAAESAVKLTEKLMALKAELEASGISMADINVDLSKLLA